MSECCNHNCNEGRTCPERTQRQAERLISQDPIGVECALPIQYAEPEPFDWQALVLWIAVVVCFAAVFALSIADPRDLSTLWPRLVAAVSL